MANRPSILQAIMNLPARERRDIRARLFLSPELFEAAQGRFERKTNAIASGNANELKRVLREERTFAMSLLDRLAEEEVREQITPSV